MILLYYITAECHLIYEGGSEKLLKSLKACILKSGLAESLHVFVGILPDGLGQGIQYKGLY